MYVYIYIYKGCSKTRSFRDARRRKGQRPYFLKKLEKNFQKIWYNFCYSFQKLGKEGSAPSFYGYCRAVEIYLFYLALFVCFDQPNYQLTLKDIQFTWCVRLIFKRCVVSTCRGTFWYQSMYWASDAVGN